MATSVPQHQLTPLDLVVVPEALFVHAFETPTLYQNTPVVRRLAVGNVLGRRQRTIRNGPNFRVLRRRSG